MEKQKDEKQDTNGEPVNGAWCKLMSSLGIEIACFEDRSLKSHAFNEITIKMTACFMMMKWWVAMVTGVVGNQESKSGFNCTHIGITRAQFHKAFQHKNLLSTE